MHVTLIMLVSLFMIADASAQQRRPKGFGLRFEGVHADLSTAIFWGTASLNVDGAYFRSKEVLLGARAIAFTHGATNDYESEGGGYAQYGTGALALLSHRTPSVHVDLAGGAMYFHQPSPDAGPGWDLHVSFDIRVMIEPEAFAVLFHGSTSSGGIGIAIGWMRN